MPELYLEELTLSHFRSHRLTRIEADARPVAIHGPNGAGKTNILEAISLLSPGRGLRRAVVEDMSRKPDALGWKVAATLVHNGQRHEVETRAAAGQPRTVRIDDKAAPQVALGRIARILWLVPSMDRLWIEGAEGRRRFLDRMTMSFEPAHAEATLTYEKAMRERNRLLRDQVQDPHWYNALEAQMAEAGAEITRNRLHAIEALSAAQGETRTEFPTASLRLAEPDAELNTDEPEGLLGAFREGRSRDLMAGRTLIGPHRSDLEAIFEAKDIAARDASTGEQKALLISLIIANARALAADFGAPPILLLDEVAAHLDASRRAALYDEIESLKTQAWMTGTGPELFSSLGARARYLEVTDTGAASTVHAASQP